VKLGIDWTESSTVRGAVKILACLVALAFLWFKSDVNLALGVYAVINGAANGISVFTKDKE
jgi:uncharacterized membrane protein HdeD (DUF308 family)